MNGFKKETKLRYYPKNIEIYPSYFQLQQSRSGDFLIGYSPEPFFFHYVNDVFPDF